jgi:serine phosphatase RsbU (regulator of sigma subunit)
LLRKYNRLSNFAEQFWPGLNSLNDQRRFVGTGEVISFLYTLPLAIIGLIWLIFITDLDVLTEQAIFLLFNLGLIFLFSRLSYFIIIEIRPDRYGSSQDSLATMILWSAVFLLGPTALWLNVIYAFINFLGNWRTSISLASRWTQLRILSSSFATNTLAILISLTLYEFIGGEFPLQGLSITSISFAFIALTAQFALEIIILTPYFVYHLGVQNILTGNQTLKPLASFFFLSIGLPHLAYPFAILLAGIYVENGFAVYIYLLIGFILVAYLARQLSWSVESSRQQSRQLEKLEQLGRALFEVIPNTSELTHVLEEHVPGMFPSGHIAIWISPESIILDHPDDWPEISDETWQWILEQSGSRSFVSDENLPWDTEGNKHRAILATPIRKSGNNRAIGGIILELRALAVPWDHKSLSNLHSGIQSLADLLASTIQQAEVYEQSLDFQSITQELRLAGKIQASFLPNKFPPIAGWQLAVTLLPARETSGDYFDVIELEDGRLGILIADVADKGVGSALYMALSRTLIRTYAEEYDADPEVVFFAANNRLLKDARANLFVTTFYGILDPSEGILTYCNAGHNPPYLIRETENETVESLTRTGIAMGIEEDTTWYSETVAIEPGDIMVFYTDGIPDAQDQDGNFFDDERIIDIARTNMDRLAHEIQSSIIDEVQNFAGNTPQTDDITLMILVRNK